MKLFEIKDTEIQKGYKLVESAVAAIKRDCKPFLKQSKGLPIYRGATELHKVGVEKTFIKKSIRNDRTPRNSSSDPAFNWTYNTMFKEMFDIEKIRNSSLFVTGSESQAIYYGSPYFVFPIGDFDFSWSPTINDSYETFTIISEFIYKNNLGEKSADRKTSEHYFLKNQFLELIDNGKYSLDDIVDQDGNPYTKLANFIKSEFKKYKYTQQDLHTAIKSNNEILIHYPCDYYLLSVDSAGKALDVKDIYCKKVYAALQSVFNETD